MLNVIDTQANRRRYRRYPVLESGLLYTDDGCVDCQVTDVSANGVRVRPVGDVNAKAGRCRFLLGRLGVFEADICWTGDDAVGIRFEEKPEAVANVYEALLPRDCLNAA